MAGVTRFAAIAALALACVSTAQAVDIQTVTVGNPGNPGDTRYPDPPVTSFGGVTYVYDIGAFGVTAGQYRDFLNAVDPAGSNPFGLYNSLMDSESRGCQITWNAESTIYDFSGRPSGTEADWVDRPVNYVSWGDAARFANWMHNGQGSGDTETGSYLLNGAMTNEELLGITRELDATWVIPSEDEWYKAAYHKNDGVTGNYFDYPTSSDSSPASVACPGGANSANYNGDDFAVGSPYYRNTVGCYSDSESPYATFDQGGNVFEWNEAVNGLTRGLRGGSFINSGDTLHATSRSGSGGPTNEFFNTGFRVATVFESLVIFSNGFE